MEKINHEEFITEMIRYASSAESPDRIINQILQYIYISARICVRIVPISLRTI